MVKIEQLSKGHQYDDLRMLFPSLLDKDENGREYIGLKLVGNHITINGVSYYWENDFISQNPKPSEDARIKLYPNSFELIIDGRRRIICHPKEIKTLFVLCNGIFTKKGNSHYHISWG